MKRMISIWAVLLCSVLAVAQTKNITITGVLVDGETKDKVEMAAIQLFAMPDSVLAAGTTSKADGKFVLPKVRPGSYRMIVSFLGYRTLTVPVKVTEKQTWVDLGVVSIHSDAVLLGETVVVADAPPVVFNKDTTEYSAAAYRVAEGAMLEDLVKKIPGIEVDENGAIKLNGKDIKKIMVDGKEFFSDDPKQAMKNLPASMVNKVRAYDKKSDMARLTGVDDGEEEAVLDLVVKPEMKRGWLGNFIGGYGNKTRYEAGAMASSFKEKSSVTVIASANNTNNKGFSEFGDAGQGLSDINAGSGITTARQLGVNFYKETNKVELSGNVQYGFSDNDAHSNTSSETFLGERSSFGTSDSWKRRQRHDARVDFRLEWKPDSMTTVIVRPEASYSHTKTEGRQVASTSDSEHRLINESQARNESKSHGVTFNGRVSLSRKMNSEGRNLYLDGRFGYSDSSTEGISESEMNFYDPDMELAEGKVLPDSVSAFARFNDQNRDSRNWSVTAMYTEPLFKNNYLQLKYDFSHRKQFVQSLVYDSIHLRPDYLQHGYNEMLSSEVENFYDSHMARVMWRGNYSKLKYSVGVGLSPQSSLSKTYVGVNANNHLPEQLVLNWAPTVFFRYEFSKSHTLMMRYNGRSSAPNIDDLQEVIDITDPMNMRFGNPNLKPSFNHTMMVRYQKFEPKKMRNYSLHLFYRNMVNAVANRMSYDPETGARMYHKENVNGNWSTYGYFSFSSPFKNRKFTISSTTMGSYRDNVNYTSVGKGTKTDQVLSTTHDFSMSERINGNYRSDAFDVSLNASVRYNLLRNSKQTNSNRETFDYYVGGSTNINLPWKLYFSTDVNCRFKNGYSGSFDNSEVLWNAQLSKNFLKNEAATIRIKVYDILQQQSNLSRTVSETMMSDTEYNTLGSYFMVHFVYRFNTLGGKTAKKHGGSKYGGRGYGGGFHHHMMM